MPTPTHLKIAILQAGLTHEELAERIAVHEGHLCHILSGRRRLTPRRRDELAKWLRRPAAELFPEIRTE